MDKFEVTKLGERGQIVIPQEFRKSMDLRPGEKFIVVEMGDTLMFKRLQAPSMEEFNKMLAKSHQHAKKHGLTEKDMWDAIKRARTKK